MIREIQKLEKQAKYNLLITTLALAIFVILIVNILIATVYMLELIKEPNYDSILLSFKEGYYTINGKKMGVSIFFNFMGIFALWGLMIFHTLKTMNKPIISVFL
ncbi:hypothetical protein [Flavobacterium humi]|uniref:Uncharacterized protein n=1 Tax=Flavobacterium humi TaxID=2562683 RepID=A0A4Z0L944_9FLAO|nr:hypothetical protein [Flavobacterium humi]TGD58539.1 hypothetical protein E4635_06400 [Flavobacterium humi]